MNETPASTPAMPGGDAAPAPAPAPAPAAPAPVETPAPAAPAPANPAPQDTEDDEWDEVTNEVFPGLSSTNKERKSEQAKPEETGEEEPAPQANPADQEPDEEPGAGDDTRQQGEGAEEDGGQPKDNATPDTAARTARQSARDYARQVEAVKSDIMGKMFADVPETLQDADGDPIRSVQDVMNLINPNTGEKFTEEEAGMWFLSAQQQFNQRRADIERQAEAIAEVNLDLKDQADAVNAKYGDYLKANPELRDELWAEFSTSLEKDEASGVITKAPLSLERFYERALAPLVKEQQQQRQAEADAQAQAAAVEKAKQEAAAKRQQARADRSDIYGGGQHEVTDLEDDEWAEAHKEVFGDRR